MRRSLAAVAVLTTLAVASSAGATPRYQPFGNLQFNDCQYESAANLVLHQFPGAKISTGEVLRAFKANGIVGPDATPAGLDYLENVGFDGHRANAEVITTRAQIIAAANAGGVFVTLGWGHAVAIVHANPRELDVVDDGADPPMTWSNWHEMYAAPGTVYYALTWAQVDTETLNFSSSYTGGSPMMTPQVEAAGSTEAIETNAFVNDGYQFEGWSTNPQGPVQYADGAEYTFTKGATLYALWSYCDCS